MDAASIFGPAAQRPRSWHDAAARPAPGLHDLAALCGRDAIRPSSSAERVAFARLNAAAAAAAPRRDEATFHDDVERVAQAAHAFGRDRASAAYGFVLLATLARARAVAAAVFALSSYRPAPVTTAYLRSLRPHVDAASGYGSRAFCAALHGLRLHAPDADTEAIIGRLVPEIAAAPGLTGGELAVALRGLLAHQATPAGRAALAALRPSGARPHATDETLEALEALSRFAPTPVTERLFAKLAPALVSTRSSPRQVRAAVALLERFPGDGRVAAAAARDVVAAHRGASEDAAPRRVVREASP